MASDLRSVRESVVRRMVDRRDRKLFNEALTTEQFLENMDSVVSESVQRGDDVLRMNLQFSTKSSHIPLVHLKTKDDAPNPTEIKQKDACFHVNTSRLLQHHRRKGETQTSSRDTLTLGKTHNDSAIKGVLVAMDYDTKLINLLYPSSKP